MEDGKGSFKQIIEAMMKVYEKSETLGMYIRVSEEQIIPVKSVVTGSSMETKGHGLVIFSAVEQDESLVGWDAIIEPKEDKNG